MPRRFLYHNCALVSRPLRYKEDLHDGDVPGPKNRRVHRSRLRARKDSSIVQGLRQSMYGQLMHKNSNKKMPFKSIDLVWRWHRRRGPAVIPQVDRGRLLQKATQVF